MLAIKFGLPVQQFVLYTGNKKKLKNLTGIYDDGTTRHDFRVIILKSIDYEKFLEYDIPEVVTLAILGDFKGKQAEVVIEEILHRLDETAGSKRRHLPMSHDWKSFQTCVTCNR